MEKLWGEHLSNPSVKEVVDTLMEAEKSWLDFVDEVESELGSVKKTFQLGIMIHYAETIVANSDITITRAYPGDDVVLIAGDFIADSSGKLVYVYNATHAHDRPTVEKILSSLDAAVV